MNNELKHSLNEIIGHASTCWTPNTGSAELDSTEADKCATNLHDLVESALESERTQASIDIIIAMSNVGIEFAHSDWRKDKEMTVRELIGFVADRARQMDAPEQPQ